MGNLISKVVTGTGVSVGTSVGDIVEISCEGYSSMGIEVKNEGATNAFNAFQVQISTGRSATWHTIASQASDFSTPAGLMVTAVGAPVTLGTETAAVFIMSVRGVSKVRLRASVASSTTTAGYNVTLEAD